MDLLLNNLQKLICHKPIPTNQPTEAITNTGYVDELALLQMSLLKPNLGCVACSSE